MNFGLSDEQRELTHTLAQVFLDQREGRPLDRPATPSETRGRWQTVADLGVLSLGLPEDRGGFGDLTDVALMAEAAGHALSVEPIVLSGLLPRDLLAALDSCDQDDLADALRSGRSIAAVAAGLQVAHAPANAQPLLDGTAIVAGLGVADLLLCPIEDAHTGSWVLYCVTADVLSIDQTHFVDGTWGGIVTLAATPARFVGPLERRKLLQSFTNARIALIAQSVGLMSGALELTTAHLRTREQFGQPLAEQQALRHIVADIAVMIERARAYLHVALAGASTLPPEASATEVVAIQQTVSELAITACERAVQLHGGMGVTIEHSVGHHLRHAVVLAALPALSRGLVDQFGRERAPGSEQMERRP